MLLFFSGSIEVMIPTKFHSWKLYFYVPDQCFLTKVTAQRSNLWSGVNYSCCSNINIGTWCQLFCFVFFHETWDKILATTTTIANLPVASHVGTAEEGFQALFGSCRKSVCRPVRKSYLWVLLELLVDSGSDGTQVWGLSNIVKWNEKLYHRKYKMMILREIFSFISK